MAIKTVIINMTKVHALKYIPTVHSTVGDTLVDRIPRREAGENFLRHALSVIRLGKEPLPGFILAFPEFILAGSLLVHLAEDLIHRPLHQPKAKDGDKNGEDKHDKGLYAEVHVHGALLRSLGA